MIFVCGLSKCGKTSLISAAKTYLPMDWMFVRGSQLLSAAGRSTSELSINLALLNQQKIAEFFRGSTSQRREILFDGHLLIETVDGPFLVPDHIFDEVALRGIISIEADPLTLSLRREAYGMTNNIEDLSKLSSMEMFHAQRIASRKGAPHHRIQDQNELAFSRLVMRLALDKKV